MGFFDDLTKNIKDALSGDIDEMLKGDGNHLTEKPQEIASNEGSIGQKAIITDPFFDQVHQHFIFRNKLSRISNKTLKDTSVRDWLVSAIIQARCDTMLRFARPQRKNLDLGYVIRKKDTHSEVSAADKEIIANVEDYIYHCGRKDKVPPGEEMLFGEFLKLATRDAITYGHVAVEKILTRRGSLHRFRPLPSEAMYLINPKTNKSIIAKEIAMARTTYKMKQNMFGGNNPEAVQEFNDPDIEYFKYVQMSYDNRVLAAFGDEDMIWKLFNPQNFSDAMGYCYVPKTAYVLMADGTHKFVEDVEEGDEVITHTGNIRKVYDLKQRTYDDTIVIVEPYGMSPQVVTKEHPLLVAKEGVTAKDFVRFQDNIETKWMSASDVKVGDYIVVPRLSFENNQQNIDLSKYGSVRKSDGLVYSSDRGRVGLPPVVAMSTDIAWLIGLYAGDGCILNKKSVRIDLSAHEGYLLDRISSACSQLGLTPTFRETESNIHVSIHSKVFADFILDQVPGKVTTKKISKLIFNSTKEQKVAFICGYIEADGNVSKFNKKITAASVSSELAYGIANIFNSLGYLCKVKKSKNGPHGDIFNLKFPRVFEKLGIQTLKSVVITDATRKTYISDDKNFYVRVRKVSSEKYVGKVYNFEVEEDHSYIVNQAATHNCYSPLELAIVAITNHLSVENYNSNFFTHGYAARGILHLKGTVTQAQLTAFRRQFYNTISGAQNAWRTPIIAGLDEVQWVPLSGSAKEMEYLNYNNHLMRSLCTQFQIDPIELGLEYLANSSARGGGQQQANNEYKINYSRERGLIPILMMFEDMINCSILPALDREIAAHFEFKFTGIDEDSPQTQVAQLQAEMTVHSTMNDLLRAAGKETMKHVVGDLPLNQTFWALVEKNMTKAEIRRDFFGDKTAMDKRELAYFPADPAFMGWTQLLLTMDRSRAQDKIQADQMKAQQAQADQQTQQAASQQGLDEKKHDREQEAHDMEMNQMKARQAHAAVAHESLKDSAKQFGAGSKALVGPDGTPMANPINSDTADET